MKIILRFTIAIFAFALLYFTINSPKTESSHPVSEMETEGMILLSESVREGDTLEEIFKRYGLDRSDALKIYNASRNVYNLSKIHVGNIYSILIKSKDGSVLQMDYGLNETSFLRISRNGDDFRAKLINLPVAIKTGYIHLRINKNLIESMPEDHEEYRKIALKLADIMAWDIDFSNDLREGDSIDILVEEKWINNAFIGYGEILAVEIINNGRTYKAYRYEYNGQADYYDQKGRSLRKSLLRSPLRYRYISSGFSKRRLHPMLRTYRPHLGVDYAAPAGTPVSAAGDGKVIFAGYKNQNGRLVIIRHNNGYITYYGHLARIKKGIRRGKRVRQGEIIGYVGSSGLATGPHLDYRIKYKGRFVNPLTVKLPRGKPIPAKLMSDFRAKIDEYENTFAMYKSNVYANTTMENKG